MYKTYKVRLFPTEEQVDKLNKTCGACRFIWNWALNFRENYYKLNNIHLNYNAISKKITALRKQEDYFWLNEISLGSLNLVLKKQEEAYTRYFDKQNNFPKFKSKKKSKKYIPTRYDRVNFKDSYVSIDKIGRIRYTFSYKTKPMDLNIKKASISLIHNKWILFIVCECENQAVNLTNNKLGIDLGIKELATCSLNYEKIVFHNINKSKKIKKLNKKLKHIQRIICRKYRINSSYNKTNNILKYENILRNINYKISNIRRDYIHKCTSYLVSLKPNTVVMETLNIKGMMKNRHLSKAIGEQYLFIFTKYMKYKCELYGINFIQVPRFYPSSKLCSSCGAIKNDLKLSDRTYICEECGLIIDRDENAAINLMNYIQ